VEVLAMSRTEDNAVDRSRLEVVLGSAPPRYLTVAEAARASGFSRQAVYRAIERGDLPASVVCSRIRIHPDDFLAWMDGDRAATAPSEPRIACRVAGQVGARKKPAPDGLRGLLAKQRSSAA
jgi:excisionase family DNA binding protein